MFKKDTWFYNKINVLFIHNKTFINFEFLRLGVNMKVIYYKNVWTFLWQEITFFLVHPQPFPIEYWSCRILLSIGYLNYVAY